MSPHANAPLGSVRFSAYDLVPMSVVYDVPVLPTTTAAGGVYNGGPVLPEWADQQELRHGRDGTMIPGEPPEIPAHLPYLDEAVTWGGHVGRSPGQLVSEYTTRVLPSLEQRPNDRVMFALWPNAKAEDAPDIFWDVLAWYGVPREQVILVDQPLRVRELAIAPQPEQANGLGPSYRLLELLAENTTARMLEPTEDTLVYVATTEMTSEDPEVFIGEQYLMQKLRDLGVTVLEPDSMSLRAQLEAFAGAENIVFAEGPALHLRQLLGYYDQDVTVLARRPGARTASVNLLPRCRMLTYSEATEGMLKMVFRDGTPDTHRALSAFDAVNLFRVFEVLGVHLQDVWKPEEYQETCRVTLLSWLRRQFNQVRQQSPTFDWEKSIAQVRRDLNKHGFEHVFPDANFWLKRKDIAS